MRRGVIAAGVRVGLSVVAAEVCSPFTFANYTAGCVWERLKLGARPMKLHASAITGATTVDTWSSRSTYAVITRRTNEAQMDRSDVAGEIAFGLHAVIIVVCSRFISGNCTAS